MVLLNHVGRLILCLAAGAVVVSITWHVLDRYSFPKRRARLELAVRHQGPLAIAGLTDRASHL